MTNPMLMIALFGDPIPVTDTPRNRLLRAVRRLRALRSWITVGCYAWWRLTDDIKATQRLLAAERWT